MSFIDFQGLIGFEKESQFSILVVMRNLDPINRNANWNGEIQFLLLWGRRSLGGDICLQGKGHQHEGEKKNSRRQFHGGLGVV